MMTIEQIKQDIADGKVNAIYYSSQTLWWTHLDEDVEQATKTGEEASRLRNIKFMSRPDVPEAEKKRMENLLNSLEGKINIPLDVTGSPLFYITDKEGIERWISTAEQKPDHFGRYGLEAFLRAHHRNCQNRAWSS